MRSVERQKGAVILTVAFALLFLLGFMAIALDFGHLFVVKTELQTAVDSCALAAAQELDGGSDALTRATSAGRTAGNLNKVNFQGTPAGIGPGDITFSDSLTGAYSPYFTPVANAKYAKCTHTQSGMAPWLMQVLGAFAGNAAYGAPQSVRAVGVATRAPAQAVCNALPVQIKPKSPASVCPSPFWGYCPGEWIPSLYNEGANNAPAQPGQFGWANLDNTTNASETKAEVLGKVPCDLTTGSPVGTPGGKVAVSTQWNSRFGLYVNGPGNPKITDAAPDTSGYSYRAKNWPSQANAVGDFLTKRAGFRSYGDTTDTINAGNTITGLGLNNNYKDALMGANNTSPNLLSVYGMDRRLVIAPIVPNNTIAAWACLLMLHPIDGPQMTVYVEFVGDAASTTSPCAATGLPGGTTGPRVPVLVQ